MSDDDKPEKLWVRQGFGFQVELRVGKVWVHHCDVDSQDRAHADAVAAKALEDMKVSAVRVLELRHETRCYVRRVLEASPMHKLPPKMKPTGEHGRCGKCHKRTVIADDGEHRWSVCTPCRQTMPV